MASAAATDASAVAAEMGDGGSVVASKEFGIATIDTDPKTGRVELMCSIPTKHVETMAAVFDGEVLRETTSNTVVGMAFNRATVHTLQDAAQQLAILHPDVAIIPETSPAGANLLRLGSVVTSDTFMGWVRNGKLDNALQQIEDALPPPDGGGGGADDAEWHDIADDMPIFGGGDDVDTVRPGRPLPKPPRAPLDTVPEDADGDADAEAEADDMEPVTTVLPVIELVCVTAQGDVICFPATRTVLQRKRKSQPPPPDDFGKAVDIRVVFVPDGVDEDALRRVDFNSPSLVVERSVVIVVGLPRDGALGRVQQKRRGVDVICMPFSSTRTSVLMAESQWICVHTLSVRAADGAIMQTASLMDAVTRKELNVSWVVSGVPADDPAQEQQLTERGVGFFADNNPVAFDDDRDTQSIIVLDHFRDGVEWRSLKRKMPMRWDKDAHLGLTTRLSMHRVVVSGNGSAPPRSVHMHVRMRGVNT